MKYRVLAAIPFVFTAIVAIVFAMYPEGAGRLIAMRAEIELVKALALIGCVVAASSFERGDYLRRAWLLNGACFVVLILRDVTFKMSLPQGPQLENVQASLVLVANIVSIAGTWMMARTWQVAGIDPSQSKARIALILSAAAIALTITGTAIYTDIRDATATASRIGALEALASDFGDVFSLCVIAPVLLTAWAMRGGVLRWPWALYTASLFGWLVYDAIAGVSTFVTLDPWTHRLAGELCRTISCTFLLSAGIAQRLVIASFDAPSSRLLSTPPEAP